MTEDTFEMSNFLAECLRTEGKSEFSSGNFSNALICFNKTLCFAKTNEIKTLTFANRSAVYLEMKRYQQCLENIQLARASGHPVAKMLSLNQREEKCRNLLEVQFHRPNPSRDPWSFFKLSHPANQSIPFIVDCLELRDNQKYGRHIITNRNLKPGDVIAIEEPFLNHLDKKHCYQRCSNCLKSNILSLMPCEGRCVDTMFCSTECLDQARHFHNRFTCPKRPEEIFSRLHRAFLDSCNFAGSLQNLQELIERSEKVTIFDFDLTNLENHQTKRNQLKAFLSLMPRSTSWIEDNLKMDELVFLARITLRSFWTSEQGCKRIVEILLRLSRILELNTSSFESSVFTDDLESPESRVMGEEVCLFAALLNHSCNPNVACINVDNKLVTVVQLPVKAGEQLFKSYSSPFYAQASREERRDKLFKQYHFKCDCQACFNNWELPNVLKAEYFILKGKSFPSSNHQFLLGGFKEVCRQIRKNISKHPCRETILFSSRLICLLRHFSTFGSSKPSKLQD